MRTAAPSGHQGNHHAQEQRRAINDVLKRPHTINPDALAKPAAKPVKITAIDDEGVVKDGTMTVNLYHILDNSHAD